MVLLLFIIKLVEVASSAFVQAAATAVENIVGLATGLWLFLDTAGDCSFGYRPFGNLGAFICLRIGLTALIVKLIHVFFEYAASFRGRGYGVRKTSA